MSMNFIGLRQANQLRLPLFKNRRGGFAHSMPDGSDWSLDRWMNAILGELGEAANVLKKYERGDYANKFEFENDFMDELADVVTYVDITAFQLRRSLGEAVRLKFNRVSERVGADVKFDNLGRVWYNGKWQDR